VPGLGSSTIAAVTLVSGGGRGHGVPAGRHRAAGVYLQWCFMRESNRSL
jgi:hypothetical protein